MENIRDFTKTLKSGLRIVYRSIPGLYSVAFGVMVGVGSRFEPQEVNGYSHFIEHLVFKGTTNRTALQISEEIEGVGGQINAFTSKDTTCFFTVTAGEHLEKSFNLLSDMMFNALFDLKDITKEKKVILEEISMGEDMPDECSHELLAKALYGGQKLGRPIVGTPQNIRRSSRESILNYRDTHYVASNTVISVAGNSDFDTICKLAEKYFEDELLKRGNSAEREKLELPQQTAGFLHKFKDVEQAHLTLGFPYYEVGHPSFFAGSILSNLFGGGMSSRLFQSVREKNGLAYSVYSYPSSYADTGYLEIYVGTNPGNTTKVAKLIKHEIDKLLSGGVSVREFERAKAQLIGSTMLSQDSAASVMVGYGTYMLRKNVLMNVDERLANINAVTIDDVRNATNFIFGEGCRAAAYVGKKIPDYNFYKLLK